MALLAGTQRPAITLFANVLLAHQDSSHHVYACQQLQSGQCCIHGGRKPQHNHRDYCSWSLHFKQVSCSWVLPMLCVHRHPWRCYQAFLAAPTADCSCCDLVVYHILRSSLSLSEQMVSAPAAAGQSTPAAAPIAVEILNALLWHRGQQRGAGRGGRPRHHAGQWGPRRKLSTTPSQLAAAAASAAAYSNK